MPWLSEAKKDVISCEKPGSGANNRTIPGYPNGATRYREAVSFPVRERQTRGTETSQYPQEKKTTVIAPVVASESAGAQTGGVSAPPGLKDRRKSKSEEAELPGKVSRRG